MDNPKIMDCLHTFSLREMVKLVNEAGIQKEDIVYLHKEEDSFFLLYYK